MQTGEGLFPQWGAAIEKTPPSQLLHMIAGWGVWPFRAQGEDIGLGMTEEGKGQLGAFKGSSMEVH